MLQTWALNSSFRACHEKFWSRSQIRTSSDHFSNISAWTGASSCLPRIIGFATRTFMCHYMEVNLGCFCTVIAKNPNHLVLINFRDRRRGNLLVQFLPNTRHVTIWSRANRTRILEMLFHLHDTFQMHGVTTRQDCDIFCCIKNILKANRAVVVHCSFYTNMWFLHQIWIAASTSVTVKEILLATRSADSTFITVVLILRNIIIKEVAFWAKVISHANPTLNAGLLNILFHITQWANNPFYIMARNIVAFEWINF